MSNILNIKNQFHLSIHNLNALCTGLLHLNPIHKKSPLKINKGAWKGLNQNLFVADFNRFIRFMTAYIMLKHGFGRVASQCQHNDLPAKAGVHQMAG